MTFDVTESDFEARVIERSREVPVVVDFWAEWCGPCRTLGPALEDAVAKRAGEVELAKLDTDRNPSLAMRFQIGSIPAVKAFKDGEVVSEFVGAIRPAQIEQFLDGFVTSAADKLAESDDEGSLREALELDPRNAAAAVKLGRILLARGEESEAIDVLDPLKGDFEAEGLAARAHLGVDGAADGVLAKSFSAWDGGELEPALEGLQEAIAASDDPEQRDLLRRVMVAIFTELGVDHPVAREHRRRLAAALA
ncbi:MAG: tetratricopeptide repeat protein [Solirubrobacterales bacterium]